MRTLGTTAIALAIAAFTFAMSPTNSLAMDPVDWSPTAELPDNIFTANGTQRIDILDIGYSGAANDGVRFVADSNPTSPSTGTGVFDPFVRIQRGTGSCNNSQPCETVNGTKVGSQRGFNTDAGEPGVNYETKVGTWTHSVMMSDFNITGSTGSIQLQLDANQNGAAGSDTNKLVITDLQIFIGSDPNLAAPEDAGNGTGYSGSTFDPGDNGLLGNAPVWQLDSEENGNVDILLQASICDNGGQCGSGHGDMNVFIPVELLGTFSDTDYFVFYSEYLYVNDGFEEWRIGGYVPGETPSPKVSEPGTVAIFALVGFGVLWRRKRRLKTLR
ncbi:MAG: hypothetical protein ACI9MJ_000083 [Alphaproteobacteria bacterium]|jgi:hypothetical protein